MVGLAGHKNEGKCYNIIHIGGIGNSDRTMIGSLQGIYKHNES